jgi:hypothetical protein
MLAFFDLEASGLHVTSFPVEVAWVSHDLSTGYTACIKPARDWTELDWNAESAAVHGLTYVQLQAYGLDAEDVAHRLNHDLLGADLVSDSPGTDFRWLLGIYAAAGVDPSFDLLPPAPSHTDSVGIELWRQAKVRHDSDYLIAEVLSAKTQDLVFFADHEFLAGQVAAQAQLMPHRALDDALRHAVCLACVDLVDLDDDAQQAGIAELAALVRDAKTRIAGDSTLAWR